MIIGCGNDRTYTGQTSYYRGMGIINDTTALVIKWVVDEYNDGDYGEFVGYNFEIRDTRYSHVYSEHLYENFSCVGVGQVSDSVFLFAGGSDNEDFIFWKLGDSLNNSMYKKYTWLTEKKNVVSSDMVVRRWKDDKFIIQNWFMGKEINMVYYIVMDTTALTLASVDSSEYALLNAYNDFQMFNNERVFLQSLKDSCGFMLLKEDGDTLAAHDCDDSYRELTLYFQNDYIVVMDGYVSSDHIRHVFSIGPNWKISDKALMYYDGSGHFFDSEENRI